MGGFNRLYAWSLGCLLLIALLPLPAQGQAIDRRGRLGIGASNQLKTDRPSVSFKLQQSRSTSLAGLVSVNTDDQGGFGAGLKIHRHFFEEPHLNFYGALLGAYLSDKRGSSLESVTGFQVDLTLGSEFHFQGLKSLGFHVDFGVSMSKLDDFVIQTTGENQFFVMGVHFYL